MMIHQTLKQYFGYDQFRDGQEQIINDALSGKDVFCVMPTGAGKSICYQVPALMTEGITLIVSPLISLMKDQVNALTQSGVRAAYINSSLTDRQIGAALQNAKNGVYKLIYTTPERLLTPNFMAFAQSVKIDLLTVDEAHCISQWGQDFRPSYIRIPEFIEALPNRPVVAAFTATATQRVREDILTLLKLQNPTVLVTGFDRPNLYFEVQKPKDKWAALTAFLRDKPGKSGIVYCATRATVEEVCEKLMRSGYSASRYHAGLSDAERHHNQDDFLYDRVKIMVATNAFGMGIDKSNVSFVAHYNMPKDVESYYQEAGRAGRDGEPADCVLFYAKRDVRTNLWMIENSQADEPFKERDRKRLREMTFYCATQDCLRGYMMKYFGEQPPNYCGHCSNCVTGFETVDITIDAQKILSCTARMNGQYGLNLVIDVLRGSKSEKIRRMGLDKLTTYGISERPDRQLREIADYLLLHGYLIKTDTQYPTVRLGERAGEILHGGAVIQMKLSKETERALSEPVKPSAVKPVDQRLFSILRELRLRIANEQNVPAFVVFADSTLTDMCLKTPKTAAELLQVSGVGAIKLERYGELFLQAIREFTQNNTMAETQAEKPRAFDTSDIETTEDSVTISVMADRINCLLLACGYQKVSGQRINDWLVRKGYLQIINRSGKNIKVPTEQGEALGITSEERVIRGENALMNQYGIKAQEMIAQGTLEIING